MAYDREQKENILTAIFNDIENGDSLRKSLINNKISSKTFYEWIDKDEEKVKQYARACEERAEALLDEMLDIVDDSSGDKVLSISTGESVVNGEVIQRSRLRYDARKWLVSKLNPKKYGDKVDLTTNGKDLIINFED